MFWWHLQSSDDRRWRVRDGALDRSAIKASGLRGDALDLRTSGCSTSAPEGAGTAASLLAKEVIPGITDPRHTHSSGRDFCAG